MFHDIVLADWVDCMVDLIVRAILGLFVGIDRLLGAGVVGHGTRCRGRGEEG
jgi:hypothetical protein